VIAYCGACFGLFTVVKAARSGAPAVVDAPVVAVAVASTGGDIPSACDAEFEAWCAIPGNEEKWAASFE